MPAFDTSSAVLETLKRQNAPGAAEAIAVVEGFFERRERIVAGRYNAERQAEEEQKARDEALVNLEAAAVEAERVIDVERDELLEQLETARIKRSTERRELRDVVDVQRLRETDDVSEILSILDEAVKHGAEVGQACRVIALQRVKSLAADEARRHVQGGPAFKALCALQLQRPSATDTAAVTERFAAKKRAVRELVTHVAGIAGLTFKTKPTLTPLPAPSSDAGRFTIGAFWEKYPGAINTPGRG